MHKHLALALTAFFVQSISFAHETIPLDKGSVEVYFSPRDGGGQPVVSLIDSAKSRVWLAGYSFTHKDIASAIVRAKQKGLDVRVVLDKSQRREKYTGATFLANNRVPLHIATKYPIMHHKFVVVDNMIGFGSMNFTKAGDEKNAENFNLFRGVPALTETYAKEFKRLEAEAEPF